MNNKGPNWIPQEKWKEIIKLVPLVGVNAIIVADNGRVLLVHRVNPPVQNEWWIPGGGMRYGESILQALQREIKEETGLDLEEAKLAHIVSAVWNERHTVEINFLVKVKNPNARVVLDDESDDWKWADPKDPKLHPHLRKMFGALSHEILFYRQSWKSVKRG